MFNMALCELILHKPKALEHLLELLHKQPDRADVPYLIGQAMHNEAHHEEEILWYRRALALDPGYRSAKEALNHAMREIYSEIWR